MFNLQGIRTGNRRALNAFCARLEARKLCEFSAHFVGFGRFVHGVACRTPAHTQLPASVTRNLLFQVCLTYTPHSALPSPLRAIWVAFDLAKMQLEGSAGINIMISIFARLYHDRASV